MTIFYKETNFTETPLGKIPQDWRAVRLGDVILDIADGGTPSTKVKEYFNGRLPWVNIEDITKHICDTRRHLSELGLKNSSGKLWNEGTVILSFGASIGKVGIARVKLCTKQGIAGIVPDSDVVDNEFLYYILLREAEKIKQIGKGMGSTITEVRPPKLKKLVLFPLPSNINEQRRITEFLSTVDEGIQKTSEVIAKTERLKKGLMEQLFTKGMGHKVFKKTKVGEIPGEWQVVKLKDVRSSEKNAIVDGPFGSSVNVATDYIESGVPVIRINNILPFKFIEDDLKYISEKKFELLKRSAVKPGDILLSKVGTIGYACIFPRHIPKALLSTTGSCKITVSKDKADPAFVCCWLNHLRPYMKRIASQSVQPFLNMDMVKNLPLVIPPLPEQEKIVEIILTVDKKLELERNEKAKLERIKQGMMDLLLTGKVRIKVN